MTPFPSIITTTAPVTVSVPLDFYLPTATTYGQWYGAQVATGNDTRSAGNLMTPVELALLRLDFIAARTIDWAYGGHYATFTAPVIMGNVMTWEGEQTFTSDVSFQSTIELPPGPNKTTGPTDVSQLSGACVEKAWGNITSNGSGGVTLNDGFNIQSVSITTGGPGGTSKILVVTMFEAMINTNYSVQVTCGDTSLFFGYVYTSGITSTTQFWIYAASPSVGGGGSLIWTTLDWSAISSTIYVRVSGRQS